MKPKRIQRKRSKGWRMPEGVVYVGRPGKWGNPLKTASEYGEWLAGGFTDFEQAKRQWILDNAASLRGKDLACWCHIDEPCHADVLLDLANKESAMTNLTISKAQTIIPTAADKDTRYRLGKFESWLKGQGHTWYQPDLATYRDNLLTDYAPATVSAHLSTIRATYQKIILNRDAFYSLVPSEYSQDITSQKTWVDEAIARIENAINPRLAPVKTTTKQDVADTEHLRLTSAQAGQLMAKPGTDSLIGLRDTALIALMLCTGIREAECGALDIGDLRQRLGGELALQVRAGKGCKQRLIPYGELSWVLVLVDKWLAQGALTDGPVFRGVYKAHYKLRPGRLSVRAIQYVLESYPIVIDGALAKVRAHDLRRTYARRLYRAGVDLLAIQQNLGHASQKTTLGYIGELKADSRKPPKVYNFDLSNLEAT